jgi:hypothetical protein
VLDELSTRLELLIDQYGAATMLETITAIAWGKADHVFTNEGQNALCGKAWNLIGKQVDQAASVARKAGFSN